MGNKPQNDQIIVGIAQIAPVWLNREETLAKVVGYVKQAGKAGCRLVAFGEALVPGYPFWIENTDGARFDSRIQKEIYSHYLDQAVQIETGHLDAVRQTAGTNSVAVYLGCIERAQNRGGHSLYCTLVYIDADGLIQSVHRKLMPTYEERLAWAPGDGHGLRVHPLPPFTVGGLNCWENWMPLARAALYGQGEDLHVAAWPGGLHNTTDITRFVAREARSYVVSASGLMQTGDIGNSLPHSDLIRSRCPKVMANGGSCLAGPDGQWVIEPCIGEEKLLMATIEHGRIREERQNFDPAGHYARPDVTRLILNRQRQSTLKIIA